VRFRFDVTKPWSLGVFLTCQVRLEQPATTNRQQQQQQSVLTASAVLPVAATAAAAVFAEGGDVSSQRLGISGSSSGLPANGSSDDRSKGTGTNSPPPQQQEQQQQLAMQLVDFGFVSTSASIAVREAGVSNKRLEKSWEHAVVRRDEEGEGGGWQSAEYLCCQRRVEWDKEGTGVGRGGTSA
jgi:hypothetical protein